MDIEEIEHRNSEIKKDGGGWGVSIKYLDLYRRRGPSSLFVAVYVGR